MDIRDEILSEILKVISRYNITSSVGCRRAGLNPKVWTIIVAGETYGITVEKLLKASAGFGLTVTIKHKTVCHSAGSLTIKPAGPNDSAIDSYKSMLADYIVEDYRSRQMTVTTYVKFIGWTHGILKKLLDGKFLNVKLGTLIDVMGKLGTTFEVVPDHSQVDELMGMDSPEVKEKIRDHLKAATMLCLTGDRAGRTAISRKLVHLSIEEEIEVLLERLQERL